MEPRALLGAVRGGHVADGSEQGEEQGCKPPSAVVRERVTRASLTATPDDGLGDGYRAPSGIAASMGERDIPGAGATTLGQRHDVIARRHRHGVYRLTTDVTDAAVALPEAQLRLAAHARVGEPARCTHRASTSFSTSVRSHAATTANRSPPTRRSSIGSSRCGRGVRRHSASQSRW